MCYPPPTLNRDRFTIKVIFFQNIHKVEFEFEFKFQLLENMNDTMVDISAITGDFTKFPSLDQSLELV